MIRNLGLSPFLFLGLIIGGAANAATPTCSQLGKSAATESLARGYMKRARLILAEDEHRFPDLGVETRWSVVKAIDAPANPGSACLVVMAICTWTNGDRFCDGEIEVLGLEKGATREEDRVVPFLDVQDAPGEVIAKIGFKKSDPSEKSFYYVKLKGRSALAATKSWLARMPYSGFSGIAVRGEKADFDPTPHRDWQIVSGAFDLRRGTTAEVLDIQAFQLDGLDGGGADGYWKGCQSPRNQADKCLVAPWGQAFIRDLKPTGR